MYIVTFTNTSTHKKTQVLTTLPYFMIMNALEAKSINNPYDKYDEHRVIILANNFSEDRRFSKEYLRKDILPTSDSYTSYDEDGARNITFIYPTTLHECREQYQIRMFDGTNYYSEIRKFEQRIPTPKKIQLYLVDLEVI